MSNVICEACGAQTAAGAKFCAGCGAAVPDVQAKQPVYAYPSQQEQAAVQPQAVIQPQAQPVYPQSPQQTVQASSAPAAAAAMDTAPMGVFSYVLTMLVFSLPILGIVFAFIWAFGANTRLNRRNFARAQLIFWGLIILVAIVAFLFGGNLVKELGTGIK